jgi:hypothetical protein
MLPDRSIGFVNVQGAVVKRLLVLVALVMTLAVSPALAAKRVALVIGNNDYATLPNRNNAKKDAESMAAKLRGLGFDVILKTNAGSRTIGRALADFENRLAKADVALVFYAGHGIQANGKNHLIPSDANIEVEEDLRFESVNAQEFLQAMNRAGTPLNIVILDACRDNPLPRRSRSAARGLAVPAAPASIKGTVMIYSAAPGQTAQDGPRGGHGVFTGALLKVLDEPGLKLEDVFKRTARLVAASTREKQDPWINSSVKGDFYFNRGGGASKVLRKAPLDLRPSADKETVFWQSIQGSNDPADYQDYLAQYPEGSFARLAKRRIKKLKAAQVAAVATARPQPNKNNQPLGLQLSALSLGLMERFNLANDVKGVVITTVSPESAAAKKGFRSGDVIKEISQKEVVTPGDVLRLVGDSRRAGRKSILILLEGRGGLRFVVLKL